MAAFFPVCLALAIAAETPEKYRFAARHMGVEVELTLYADTGDLANSAAKACFARFAELDQTLSDYNPDSELSRLSAAAGGQPQPIGHDLWNVLQASQELSRRSGGAFDLTVGPLTRLWRRARRQRQMPPADELREALAATGFQALKLDEQRRTAHLTRPGMRLDAGGIGMGYAVDEGLKVLREQGVRSALLDASGDIGASDPPPGKPGWSVAVAPLEPDGEPTVVLSLAHQAVTTSGDAYQFVEINGRRYSHIVDPRTGLGLTDRCSVTVLADNCTAADSLATAACVLGPEHGIKLIDNTPGAAALFVRVEEGRTVTYRSERWKQE